jgi:oligosaccharide reducing-end xylanase
LLNYTQKIPDGYEVAPWYDFKPAVITYSFDDGTYNQIGKGLPLLDKYNLKGSFNLITSWDQEWEGFKLAAKNGHEISSHTVTHPNLEEQNIETQISELKESKKKIEKETGHECVTLVYPYCSAGDYDLAKKFYISARACSGELIGPNPYDMFDISSIIIGDQTDFKTGKDLNNWADRAFDEKKWVMFLIHGIDGDGGYSPIDSYELELHLKYVSKNIDKFWVGTFRDISKYILEANSIIIEENNHEGGMKTISVSCQYTTTITKLDFPVTVSRIIEPNCKNPTILRESDKSEVNIRTISNKIIFDVIPGEKYQFTC